MGAIRRVAPPPRPREQRRARGPRPRRGTKPLHPVWSGTGGYSPGSSRERACESRKGNFLARTRSTLVAARDRRRGGGGARAGPRAARPAGTATGRKRPRARPAARSARSAPNGGASTAGYAERRALRSYRITNLTCACDRVPCSSGTPPPYLRTDSQVYFQSRRRRRGVSDVCFFRRIAPPITACHSDFERLHAQLRQRLRRPLKCRRWLCTFLDTDGFRLHAALEQSRVHEDVVSAVHRVE